MLEKKNFFKRFKYNKETNFLEIELNSDITSPCQSVGCYAWNILDFFLMPAQKNLELNYNASFINRPSELQKIPVPKEPACIFICPQQVGFPTQIALPIVSDNVNQHQEVISKYENQKIIISDIKIMADAIKKDAIEAIIKSLERKTLEISEKLEIIINSQFSENKCKSCNLQTPSFFKKSALWLVTLFVEVAITSAMLNLFRNTGLTSTFGNFLETTKRVLGFVTVQETEQFFVSLFFQILEKGLLSYFSDGRTTSLYDFLFPLIQEKCLQYPQCLQRCFPPSQPCSSIFNPR